MANTKSSNKSTNKMVKVFIPYIDGEDPEQTICVNYKAYKIKKGCTVEVPEDVAHVLENSSLQQMQFREMTESMKEQEL